MTSYFIKEDNQNKQMLKTATAFNKNIRFDQSPILPPKFKLSHDLDKNNTQFAVVVKSLNLHKKKKKETPTT
jgi:hypothetical protein